MSSNGHTNQEKYRHYRVTLTALGQIILIIASAMFVWGVLDMYIPTEWLLGDGTDSQPKDYYPYNPGP
jgi:hypothetical protein